MKINHRRKNPVAKDLRTPKYRMRVVGRKDLYRRVEKHKVVYHIGSYQDV